MKLLVIGATSGIGRALVAHYRALGCTVIATGRRLERLEELRAATGAEILEMDVTRLDATRAALSELWEAHGGLDLVVYNAGTGDQTLAWERERAVLDTNASGFVAVASWAYERFREAGGGHLVGVTSMMAIRGGGHAPVYSATKSLMSIYLEGLRYHAMRNGHRGIHFTEIRPGFVDTDMISGNDPKELFWVASPEQVAPQIATSIRRRARVAYVTRRWRFVGWLMRIVPWWIYGRLV